MTGPLLAAYPAVLLADTAVPAWHAAHRELPVLFVGGAMTAAGAAGLAASACSRDRSDFDAAYRLAMIGSAVESLGGYGLETMPGLTGEPYRTGPGGRDADRGPVPDDQRGSGRALGTPQPGSRRGVGGLLTGGGVCAKFAVLRAGKASAADPKYVVASQRPDATRG